MHIANDIVNSITFDFSSFAKDGSPEFIFIDGGHSYECVRSDTEKALSILAPHGVMLWHDFPNWPGVFKAVVEISKKHHVRYIRGTQLALLVKS